MPQTTYVVSDEFRPENSLALFLPHIQVKTFKDYVELYLRGQSNDDEDELPRKVVHEVVNPRWEVAVTASNGGFQQASFVNSIATTKVKGNIYSKVCICCRLGTCRVRICCFDESILNVNLS